MRISPGLQLSSSSRKSSVKSSIDPSDKNPYLYFDAKSYGEITTAGGAISEWEQAAGGSNQLAKKMVQDTGPNQPTHDNVTGFATFDGVNGLLEFSPSAVEQAGILVVATSNGIFAFEVNADSIASINALGQQKTTSTALNFYAYVLLPTTVSDWEVSEIIEYLSEVKGATLSPTGNLQYYFSGRGDLVTPKFAGVDWSGVTSLYEAFRDCTGLTSFPAGVTLSNVVNFGGAWYGCTALASFPLLDTSSGTDFSECWRSCTSLTSFPLLDVSSGTDFSNCWDTCSSLTEFPKLNVSSGTNFYGCWYGCSSLSEFPSALDLSSGTNFGYSWGDCNSLTEFPGTLDLSSGTNFYRCWYSCSSLESFPGTLDLSSGTTFSGCWHTCNSLTEFPNTLDLSSGTNFYKGWYNCSSLGEFPGELDLSSGTNFSLCWFNCNSLTEFPSELDLSSGTDFQSCWYDCNSLTEFPSALDLSSGTDFGSCWRGCNSLTEFPNALDLSSGTDFGSCWRNCSSLAVFPAGVFDDWNPASVSASCFKDTWDGCTALTEQSVENILLSISASGKWATDTGASGGTALAGREITIDSNNVSVDDLSASNRAACTALQSRGWEVVINGSIVSEYSLSLDGANDYVDTGYIVPADSTMSLSCWAKGGSGTGYQVLMADLSSGGTNASGRLHLVFHNKDIYVNMGDGSNFYYATGANTYDATSTFFDGNWHHVVQTINAETQKFYIDGALVHTHDTTDAGTRTGGTSAVLGTVGTDKLSIGRYGVYDGGYWDGEIDECAIWDVELDADAVAAVYNSGSPINLSEDKGNYDNKGDLVSWWRMGDSDSGAGTTVTDQAGSNNGTLTNGPEYVLDNPSVYSTYSLAFDGDNDYATSSGDSTLAAKSYSFWAKSTDTGGNIVFEHGSSMTGCFQFHYGGGVSHVLWMNGYYCYWARTPASYDGNWHHHVVYLDTVITNCKWYADGMLQPQVSTSAHAGSPTSYSTGIRIGYSSFDGNLDEFAIFDGELTSAQVTALYNGGVPAAIAGAEHWWRMGEDDGGTGTTITDMGSEGDDLTLVNATFSRSVPTEDATYNYRSIEFDGTNQYADAGTGLGDLLGDNYAGSLSVSVWFKADVTNHQDGIFALREDGTHGKFQFSAWEGEIQFQLNGASWKREVDFTDTTSWHHLVCIYAAGSETNSKMYLDGAAVGGRLSGSFPAASAMDFAGLNTIIGGFVNASYLFNGKIDEVAVFTSELSASQVAAIYNDYIPDGGVPSDLKEFSPVAWWRMGEDDDPNGTTITDLAAIVGSDKVTNGNFSDASVPDTWNGSAQVNLAGWTSGGTTHTADAHFTITDGACRLRSDGSNCTMTQPSTVVVGRTYEYSYEVTDVTTGGLTLHGGGVVIGLNVNSTGTYTGYFTAASTTGMDVSRYSGATDVTFDNVTVRQVNGNPATLVNGPTFSTDTSYIRPVDPLVLNPYLYFDADAGVTTSGGAVSAWTQVTAGTNQIARTLAQSTANLQPAHDSADGHITFDVVSSEEDKLEYSSAVTQAGIAITATSNGIFAYEVDADSVDEITALGFETGYFQGIDLYAMALLPTTVTDAEIAGVIKYFEREKGATRNPTGNLNQYWRGRTDLVAPKFDALDFSGATSFSVSWYGCTSLTEFPGTLDLSGGTIFSWCWESCSSLTEFPGTLDLSSGTTFYSCWYNCNSLTEFPGTLDLSSGTNFGYCWHTCNSLTEFPSELDLSSGTNFNETWRACSGLTSFPLLDVSSGTNFGGTWRDCDALTSFRSDLDLTGGTSFNQTWYSCSGLLSFPAIDLSAGLDFTFGWSGCTSMVTFGACNMNAGLDFSGAWANDTAITTFPAGVFDDWAPTSVNTGCFYDAWKNCNVLTEQSVENILLSISASGVHPTSDGTASGTLIANREITIGATNPNVNVDNLSASNRAACTALQSRGWEVVINGSVVSEYALSFNGTDEYVEVNGVTSAFSDDDAYSFSCWFKTDGTAAGHNADVLFSMNATDGSNIVRIGVDRSNDGIFYADAGTADEAIGSTDYNDEAWHHLVITRAAGAGGQTVTAYVDGASVGTESDSDPAFDNAAYASIGQEYDGASGTTPSDFFAGDIDEVALWDVALDADAVAAVYNSGSPINLNQDKGNYDNSDDIVSWWRMGDNDSGAGNFMSDVIATDGEALHLPGVASNYASVPDAADLDGFTDFTLEAKGVTFADWTPSADQGLMSKYKTSGNERSWRFQLESSGQLTLILSFDGTATTTYTATTATGMPSDGATADIMVMRTGEDVRFYVNGVKLGDDVTCVTTALKNSTDVVAIGAAYNTTGNPMSGSIQRARVWNSAVANQATPTETPVLDMNFTLANKGWTSFTATSGQVVTINTSGDNPAAIRSATDGVLVNGPTFVVDNPPNYSNYSVHFDGVNDYCRTGLIPDFIHTGATMSFWVNSDVFSGSSGWEEMGCYTGGGGKNFYLGYYNDKAAFGVHDTNKKTTSLSAYVAIGDWHHLALVADAGTATFYLDGVARDTFTYTPDAAKNPDANFVIGAISLGAGVTAADFITGDVDEVAVWDSALTSAQINAIYNGGVPAALADSPVGWWRMGENDSGTGTTITDQGSGGNDGTLTNSPTFERSVPAEDATWNNRSLSFNGTNEYITTTANDTLASKSFSFWAKSNLTTANAVFSHGGDLLWGQGGAFIFNKDTGKSLLYMEAGTGRYWNDNAAQDDDAWHHHCVVIDITDVTNCKWYVDGVVQTPSTTFDSGSMLAYTTGTRIGRGGTNYFDGELDEFAIFDGELTPAQVLQIYNGGSPADLKEFSPESWWRMGDDDDAGGTTIRDLACITGDELITGFTNGTASALNTLTTSGRDISSAIESSDGWGGCASNQLSITVGEVYEVSFNLTHNSGTTVKVTLVNTASGSSGAMSNSLHTSTDGVNTVYLTATGTDSTSFLEFSNSSGANFNFSATNISLKQVNGNPGTLVNTPTFSTDIP